MPKFQDTFRFTSTYLKKHISRVWIDSLKVMGWEGGLKNPCLIRSLIFWIIASGLIYIFGWKDELQSNFRGVASFLMAGGLLFSIVFIAQLIISPMRIDKEQEDKIRSLEIDLENRKKKDARASTLLEHIEGRFKHAKESILKSVDSQRAWVEKIDYQRVQYEPVMDLDPTGVVQREQGELDMYINVKVKNLADSIKKPLTTLNGYVHRLLKLKKAIERNFHEPQKS